MRLSGKFIGELGFQRMQKKSLAPDRFGEGAIKPEIAVGLVADNRHMAFGALHPQLVAAAGLRLQLDERGRKSSLRVLEQLKFRECRNVARHGLGADLSALAADGHQITPDHGFLHRFAEDKGAIIFPHLLLRKLFFDGAGEQLRRRAKNHPGGRPIQPIEQPQPADRAVGRLPAEALGLGVVAADQQRTGLVGGLIRMLEQAGRFVESDEPLGITGEQLHLASEWKRFPKICRLGAHQ